mmetsp:Transcript_13497/g.37690  ORF Transcript_13497/g.37690 Transcript_13497/m.37690 type:complete len:96 (-) Transcript_13497:95-382(-)
MSCLRLHPRRQQWHIIDIHLISHLWFEVLWHLRMRSLVLGHFWLRSSHLRANIANASALCIPLQTAQMRCIGRCWRMRCLWCLVLLKGVMQSRFF